jgi:hypothetical protein
VRQVLENPSYRAAAPRLGEAIRRDAASDLLVCELEAAGGNSGGELHATLRIHTLPVILAGSCTRDTEGTALTRAA